MVNKERKIDVFYEEIVNTQEYGAGIMKPNLYSPVAMFKLWFTNYQKNYMVLYFNAK